MKSFVLATICAALVGVASAAVARPLDAILSAGTLNVGVNPNFPPTAMYNDKNELQGFDIDLSNKLGEMLGVKVNFVVVDPNSRIPFLTSGRIDMVLGGMTRVPARAKLIDFTTPIMTESLGGISVEGKPFAKIEDLNKPSVTLAEVRGTTPIPWIAAHLPQAKVILLDNHPDVLRAIAQGRADAAVDDIASLGQLTKTVDAKWHMLEGHAAEVDWDCIGVNKADGSLKSWLNVALFALVDGKFVADDYKKWFGFDMSAPIVGQPYF